MDRFNPAAREAKEGLWDWNLATGRIHFSRRWISMLGYEEGEFGNTTEDWFKRIHPEDFESARREIDAQLENNAPQIEIQHRMQHKDGSYRWMICRGVVTRDATGRAMRITGRHLDITAEKVVDPLTGLPNRLLLMDRLTRSIGASKRRNDFLFAVLILDLDLPESLRDRTGSTDGDLLVISAARRLETCLRSGDTVARLGRDHVVARSGGDQFIILIDGLNELGEAKTVGERLLKEISVPFEVNGREVFLTASLGIALSATGYRNAEEALRDADTALYRAQSLGKSRCEVFDTAILQSAKTRIQLEADLREALKRQEFVIVYQPIVSLTSRRIAGFEALVRWNHPVRGVVSPGEFIPIAEQTGLIIPLGRWILGQACRQLKSWKDDDGISKELWLSVNISCIQFKQSALAEDVRHILSDSGFDANSLVLELTESAVMENPEAAASALMQLRVMGAKVALDDFGTGYSSLAHLRRFPVDYLKIDHSFVRSMETSDDARKIIATISGLARQLGLCVIAEGIESGGQLELLQSLHCEFGQGFLFSEGVGSDKARALLNDGFASASVPRGLQPVASEAGEEDAPSLRPTPAPAVPDETPVRETKRSSRLRAVYAVAGLTALALLLLGGWFARLNRVTSPPVAFTSSPAVKNPLPGSEVSRQISTNTIENPVSMEKPAPAPPARRDSKPPSAKAAANPPRVVSKPGKEKPDSAVLVYPVVHDHAWGSCKGILKITRQSIAYISEDQKHSFDLPYSVSTCVLERDRLTVKSGSKTYHFESASAGTKEEKRSLLEEIHQSISMLRQDPASKDHSNR